MLLRFTLVSVVFALLGHAAALSLSLSQAGTGSNSAPNAADVNAQFYGELDKIIAKRSSSSSSSLARNAKSIQCPVGYVPSTSEDTCHYFSPPWLLLNSWFYAKSACQTVGGRLASIETSQEDLYLRDTLKRLYTGTENYHIWIGGTCLRTVSQFRWSHNDTLVKYFGWYSGQPNNAGGAEHCIAMRRDMSYAWDDVNCAGYAHRCICEYP